MTAWRVDRIFPQKFLTCLGLILVLIPLWSCASPAQRSVDEKLWDEKEVVTATSPEQCQPVAALPKQRQKEWILGFINPNLTHPFFQQRDAGMAAAAEFYGIDYLSIDADNGSSYNLLASLMEENPDLIGSHNDVDAIASIAKAENIPFLSVDLMPVKFDLHPYGVPNALAGKLGGELLVQGLKEKMAGEWQGKELFFLGLTASSIPACVTRVEAATKTVMEAMGIDENHLLYWDSDAGGKSPDATLLSIVQDNPQAVVGIIPCWDQLGIDPYQSLAAAGHASQVLLVTLGGDQSNLEFLKTKPEGYYGLVEFQPFCEGWSWVETALAILEEVPFHPYEVSRTVTQSNIDERYLELYGGK